MLDPSEASSSPHPLSSPSAPAPGPCFLDLPDDVLRIIWHHLHALSNPPDTPGEDDNPHRRGASTTLGSWPSLPWIQQQAAAASAASPASWTDHPHHALHSTCRQIRLRTSSWINTCVITMQPDDASTPCPSFPTTTAPPASHILRFPRLATLLHLNIAKRPALSQAAHHTGSTPPSCHTLLAAAGDRVASVTSLLITGFTAEETCDAVRQLPGSCPLLQRLCVRAGEDLFHSRRCPGSSSTSTGTSLLAELAGGLTQLAALRELRLEVHDAPGPPAEPAQRIGALHALLGHLAAATGLTHLCLQPIRPCGIPAACLPALPALPLLLDLGMHVCVDAPPPGPALSLPLPPTLLRLRLEVDAAAPRRFERAALAAPDVECLLRCPRLEQLQLRNACLSAPAAQLLLARLGPLEELAVEEIGAAGAQELGGGRLPPGAAGSGRLRSLTIYSGEVDPEALLTLQLGGLRELRLPRGCVVSVGQEAGWSAARAARQAAALHGLAQLLDRCWVPAPPEAGPRRGAVSGAGVYRMTLSSLSPPAPEASAAAAGAAPLLRALAPLGRRLSHLALRGLTLDRGAVDALRLALPRLRELQLLGCSAAPEVLNSMLMLSVRGVNVVIKRQ